MSDRSADLLVDDIKESIGKIDRYILGMSAADFIKDEKTIDAVVRNLEIIGEAANRLPEDFTNQHPNIEWRKIIGLRHRIVHEYFGVDLDLVWQIITNNLEKLKEDLSQIHP
jgi:uncharacterized protein with HEPN domain